MNRIVSYLIVALIAFALGVASVIALIYFQRTNEQCIDFPNLQDRYVIVIDKTTGKEFRVKNCSRP